MIRILCIGPNAADVSERLVACAPTVDVGAERLPAGAVRSFQTEPADVLVFCWDVPDARMSKIIEVLRSTPLGGMTPTVAVTFGDSDEDLDVDAVFGADAAAAPILAHIASLLGVDESELVGALAEPTAQPLSEPPAAPSYDRPPGAAAASSSDQPTLAETVAERVAPVEASTIESKLRQVRHESYFEILEIAEDAEVTAIRDAYETLSRRFDGSAVAHDLTRRYGAELDEVREALDDAYAVLLNDDLRAVYADGESR